MKVTNTKNIGAGALKILIFGVPGSGKTTLAKTTGEKTLVISAEAGLLCLQDSDIDVIDITRDDAGGIVPKEKRIARLGEAYKYLCENETQKKYKWVFIDSLTELSQNLLEQLQLEYPNSSDTLKMYGELARRTRSLVKSFRDLPYYNVVFTALSEVEKDENGQRFISVNMIGKISGQIPAFFDLALYLTADKEGKRVLLTQGNEKVISKDRSGKLDRFEEPNLKLISDKVNGKVENDKKVQSIHGEQPGTSKVKNTVSASSDAPGDAKLQNQKDNKISVNTVKS